MQLEPQSHIFYKEQAVWVWVLQNFVPESQVQPVPGGVAARSRAALCYFLALCKSQPAQPHLKYNCPQNHCM